MPVWCQLWCELTAPQLRFWWSWSSTCPFYAVVGWDLGQFAFGSLGIFSIMRFIHQWVHPSMVPALV